MKVEHLASFTQHEGKNLFLTLQVSKSVLDQAPLLNDILDLLAWSGNSFMGISLMAAILNKKESELYTPLNLGVSLHLLQKAKDGERYDIHRLVRQVRQMQFPITNRVQWIKDICQRLGDWFEERRKEFTNLSTFEAEIDHLKEWLKNAKPHSSNHSARLTWLQAYPPYHWGKYNESQQLVQSALSLLSKTSEEDPKLKANTLNDLGCTYYHLGQFRKGLKYQIQAMQIQQETFGELHADTASSFNNLIYSLTKLKKFKEARDRLNDYLDQLPQDHQKYEELSSLKNFIHKEERKSMGSVPSKKKKKNKKK